MTPESIFADLLINDNPQAIAWIMGSEIAPELNGRVKFFNTPFGGVLVEAQIFGLPPQNQLPLNNNSNTDTINMINNNNINPLSISRF